MSLALGPITLRVKLEQFMLTLTTAALESAESQLELKFWLSSIDFKSYKESLFGSAQVLHW